jgi:uncharacterized phage infection (PIP) family protein YhgE
MENENKEVTAESSELQGAFLSSLTRNNREIKKDRATAIAEDAQLTYKRKVEDLQYEMKKLRRERDQMLDLSPTNTQSLMLANDFDSKEFVERELKLGIQIRELEITLEIAVQRYTLLFGGA